MDVEAVPVNQLFCHPDLFRVRIVLLTAKDPGQKKA
jgi:hypothetical protein